MTSQLNDHDSDVIAEVFAQSFAPGGRGVNKGCHGSAFFSAEDEMGQKARRAHSSPRPWLEPTHAPLARLPARSPLLARAALPARLARPVAPERLARD